MPNFSSNLSGICAATVSVSGWKPSLSIVGGPSSLFFAFVYNAAGAPIAAGALYPFFGVLLSPIIAGAAMALSSVSVTANALRLRVVKL